MVSEVLSLVCAIPSSILTSLYSYVMILYTPRFEQSLSLSVVLKERELVMAFLAT